MICVVRWTRVTCSDTWEQTRKVYVGRKQPSQGASSFRGVVKFLFEEGNLQRQRNSAITAQNASHPTEGLIYWRTSSWLLKPNTWYQSGRRHRIIGQNDPTTIQLIHSTRVNWRVGYNAERSKTRRVSIFGKNDQFYSIEQPERGGKYVLF